MIKDFILDTNVLIHNPNAIFSFADNNVVIPITVIEELDRFKSGADKKGMHARQVLREMDGLIKRGALNKGVKMGNKGTFIIAFTPREDEIPADIGESVNDNKILAVAWKRQLEGHEVFFVSKDVNARVKAEALGIKSADYEKQKVDYAVLYPGWKEVLVSKADFTKLRVENKIQLKGYSFFDNEYAFIRVEENGTTDPILCRKDKGGDFLTPVSKGLSALGIKPLNMEQQIGFDLLLNDDIKLVTLVGQAGTGKTLMAIACALSRVLARHPIYEKMLVVRPIMPLGKDIGYLPGTKEKKLNYWMQPIFDNLEFILRRSVDDEKKECAISELTVDSLTHDEKIEVEALTYIRGRSIPAQFMIVDEAQNLTPHEIKTIISRAGEGTKIVLTGDPDQIDNPYLDANSNGLSYTVERLKKSGLFGHVLLTKSERSELATLAVNEL